MKKAETLKCFSSVKCIVWRSTSLLCIHASQEDVWS